ncbi:MAG TPA: SigE family RNA polymerase sigma factor [Acidimicrobiales bacterium]|nr:SigE family RNA polymerase sigma factor [Acidimicrobiales bacterium]
MDLYRAEHQPMVRLAFLLTGGDPAAEELVHDAFLAVHRRWDSISNPGAYLRMSVVNACRSHHRMGAVRARFQLRPSSTIVVDAPDEISDAIARLPERQRAAIVLRYFADLPEAEIAETLGCGVSAVKSLLHRALGTLREVIER